jgi:tetratricopeptide (TPR) repeat protein
LNLGLTYKKLDQFSNAVKAFDKVLSLNPNNETATTQITECQKNVKWELLNAWNI